MMDCGHSESFRFTVFSRLVGNYINNLSNHNQGTRLMFRSRQERNKQIKRSEGKRSKADWYRKDGTTNIITVPTTPGGVLATKMAAFLATCPTPGRCKTKVQEGGGSTVKRNLVRGNTFPRRSCGRQDCLLDKTSYKGCNQRCYQEGIGY